jgi:hypothetical protein
MKSIFYCVSLTNFKSATGRSMRDSPLPMRIWKDLLFVIYIQILIMDNEIFIKIFRQRHEYMRSQQLLDSLTGDERYDGPLRYLSLSLREHGRNSFRGISTIRKSEPANARVQVHTRILPRVETRNSCTSLGLLNTASPDLTRGHRCFRRTAKLQQE